MKVLAFYLPQFHETEENNLWWGKGYTEWKAVKGAKPLFSGHREPRVPLNDNYYDLSDKTASTWRWQAELARKYGVYGFCIYHYWFDGKQLLEKPMEILLNHPEIDINYSICWANETWSRNWYGQNRTVLIEQTYGAEDSWKKHFNYLKIFFQDERYIRIDNKPVLHIYRSQDIPCLPEMLSLWNRLAKELGFNGLYIISGITRTGEETRKNLIDNQYYFNPGFVLKRQLDFGERLSYLFKTAARRYSNKLLRTAFLEHLINIETIYKHIEYESIPDNACPCTFPQWDNTPRTGTSGLCYTNASPQLFADHFSKLYRKYKDKKEFVYINAWNEWGEGAYLEPDTEYEYQYLEAIRKSIDDEECAC